MYSINVSLRGDHLFSTDPASIPSLTKARSLHALFMAKFPTTEGYKTRVTYWETKGSPLTEEELKERVITL